MNIDEIKQHFGTIQHAISELNRIEIAYANNLQNHIEPPKCALSYGANQALEALHTSVFGYVSANPIAANPSDGTRGER